MIEINAKMARGQLSSLLNKVEDGEEVVISRRGRRVARIISLKEPPKRLPSLNEFRAKVKISGAPLSGIVIQSREEERY